MGNAGCLHDDHQRIRRRFLGRRWIICVLEFKGRRHRIMVPGHYTELFFLDEATALAAGHRPCASASGTVSTSSERPGRRPTAAFRNAPADSNSAGRRAACGKDRRGRPCP